MNIITSPESSAAGQTQAWYLVRPSGEIPPARSGAASVVVAGKLYMFGVRLNLLLGIPNCIILLNHSISKSKFESKGVRWRNRSPRRLLFLLL